MICEVIDDEGRKGGSDGLVVKRVGWVFITRKSGISYVPDGELVHAKENLFQRES